ncbi:ABC transporter ATP-binding protein [Rhodococcus rhodnii]|uniref:ABC-type quaternary amine transporter n=2 Tax=Rhodococcus rhodnii TaxID=38312 RepID=R7WGR5_9NOCA|nr:ABC transporter ATP-binding protein [Rhodococcus rhodnii]EOM74285.1 iron ABC transporter ATP-binding protein [Rhodococcus rhodnii LMG 5362]TXG89570.1 ABC transporter ATP-binding protein [Rhodococcus rhodnii]
MSAITLTSVGLRYPDGTVGLAGVDLHIGDGEFVALVGPSGSGKTTLLRTIAGFLTPTTATICIDDDIVAGDRGTVPPEKRRLGMVFQQHAIWPHRSVGRNVGYPLEVTRTPRRERATRVAATLDLVGLGGYENRDPATLSGGQRQRVALARALVAQPRALLLDEALSALDEPLRDRLRLELRALTRAHGLTVVHVTHDRAEALALADRVVVLGDGELRRVGTPEELLTTPGTPFVAEFLWSATLLEGRLDATGFVDTDGSVVAARGAITGSDAAEEAGTLAVLPADVELRAPDAPDAWTSGIVTSSLFGRDASDVVIACNGIGVRCAVRGPRPRVGDRVGVTVRRASFHPQHRGVLGGSPAALPDTVATG